MPNSPESPTFGSLEYRHGHCPDCLSLGVAAEVEGRTYGGHTWERSRDGHWAKWTPPQPVLRIRDPFTRPSLRVIAPCMIHAGQTIDIDLTTGTITVKETP